MSSVMLMVSDCPLQDVPYPPDFTITFDADNGTVDDMDFDHKVRKVNIPINELSTEDLLELYQLAVWKEPVTDYCYVLTRA